MMEHDDTIGTLFDALDQMKIAENTIVLYTSDNRPHMNTGPDGAMTWFRSEKDTNWEGAFRVPCLIRWPGASRHAVLEVAPAREAGASRGASRSTTSRRLPHS